MPAECAHGCPVTVVCPECTADTIRRVLSALPLHGPQPGPAPTPLAAGAIASHELLLAFIGAGFTREESMAMVLVMTQAELMRRPAG